MTACQERDQDRKLNVFQDSSAVVVVVVVVVVYQNNHKPQ